MYTQPRNSSHHIIAAVISGQLVDFVVTGENVNSEVYLGFISGVIERMQAKSSLSERPFTLFYDNAAIHKTKLVRDYIASKGIVAVLNCPYSPELNFCEQFIRLHKMKLQKPL